MHWLIDQIGVLVPLQGKFGASIRCFVYLLIWQMPVIAMFIQRKRIIMMLNGVQRLVFKLFVSVFIFVVIPALLIDWAVLPTVKTMFTIVGKKFDACSVATITYCWIIVCMYEIVVVGQFIAKRYSCYGAHFQVPTTVRSERLIHDSPITCEDEDIFNRGPFVCMLGDVIRRARVANAAEHIGVFAPWGAGKTSVLNLLKRELSAIDAATGRRRAIVVDFNPWKFRNASEALASFLRRLSDVFQKYDENLAADAFRSYAHMLRLRKVDVKGGLIGGLIDLAKQCFFAFIYSEEKAIQKVRIALCNVKSRVVVAVDDLERMPSKDVCEIVAFIKTNFDLPNIVVLYLSDKAHLSRSLEQRNATENSNYVSRFGEEYLEKIIPHQFDLPGIPKESVIKYFVKELRTMTNSVIMPNYNFETDDGDGYDTVCGFVSTIRDVKLLLNRIWEEIALHKNSTRSGALNLHLGDLVALTAIRIWAPKVYDGLLGFVSEMNARLSGVHNSSRIGMSSEEIDNWVSEHEVNKGNHSIVRTFLANRIGLRFVGETGGMRNFILAGPTDPTRRFGCRLSSPDYVYLYFEDFSNVKHLCLTVLMDFGKQIEQEIVPEELLKEAMEDGSLPALLYTLEGQSEFSHESATKTYFRALLWLSNQKFDGRFFKMTSEKRLGYISSFKYNVYASIARCIQQYVSRYNGSPLIRMGDRMVRPSAPSPELAAKFLVEMSVETPSVFLIGQFLGWDSGRHANTSATYVKQLFSHNDYRQLEECYLDNIEQMQKAGNLFESAVFSDLMREWTFILKRRNLEDRRSVMCKLLLNDLGKLENVIKFLPFIMESSLFFEGVTLGPNKFIGISVNEAKGIFNVEIFEKVNSTLQANNITDHDLRMVKYAMEYVVQNNLDADKCKHENQMAYVQKKLGIKRSGNNTFVV